MKRNNLKAYTLGEMLVAMIVASIIVSIVLINLKPSNARNDSLQKNGANMLNQISFATMNLIAKNSKHYSLFSLIDSSNNVFSIVDEGADEKLIDLYKKNLIGIRNKTVSADYLGSEIKNSTDTIEVSSGVKLKISDFPKYFVIRNGTFFAIKLNQNCTTNETYIYNPSFRESNTAKNSCGLIFFDVNSQDSPNVLGIDQYIISIGKNGIK